MLNFTYAGIYHSRYTASRPERQISSTERHEKQQISKHKQVFTNLQRLQEYGNLTNDHTESLHKAVMFTQSNTENHRGVLVSYRPRTSCLASIINSDFAVHHHSIFCLTTGPKPPLKRFLHIVRSRASSFKWEYPLLSLRSSNRFLRLLSHLLVTSISPFIFPSITCFRRQFLRKMWPFQLAFRFLISCRIFLCSLTLSNTSSFLTWSVQLIFPILLQHHI